MANRMRSVIQSDMRKHYGRSHDAVIRVYDAACNVIAAHEHAGEFKGVVNVFLNACGVSTPSVAVSLPS